MDYALFFATLKRRAERIFWREVIVFLIKIENFYQKNNHFTPIDFTSKSRVLSFPKQTHPSFGVFSNVKIEQIEVPNVIIGRPKEKTTPKFGF